MEFDHPADGEVVVTVVGSDGVRWACRVCRAIVYLRGTEWHHFGETVDALNDPDHVTPPPPPPPGRHRAPTPPPPRRTLDGEFIDTEETNA